MAKCGYGRTQLKDWHECGCWQVCWMQTGEDEQGRRSSDFLSLPLSCLSNGFSSKSQPLENNIFEKENGQSRGFWGCSRVCPTMFGVCCFPESESFQNDRKTWLTLHWTKLRSQKPSTKKLLKTSPRTNENFTESEKMCFDFTPTLMSQVLIKKRLDQSPFSIKSK